MGKSSEINSGEKDLEENNRAPVIDVGVVPQVEDERVLVTPRIPDIPSNLSSLTPDTKPLSPSPSYDNPGKFITIQNNITTVEESTTNNKKKSKSKSKARNAAGAIASFFMTKSGMSALAMGTISLIALIGGSSAYSKYTSRLNILPNFEGLEEQVDRLQEENIRLEGQVLELTTQVDRLETEVDRLEVENERFASLNSQLEGNLTVFKELNEQLTNETNRFEDLNKELEANNLFYQNLNDELEGENERLEASVNQLESSVVTLEGEVNTLGAENKNLADTVFSLNEINEAMEQELDLLTEENNDLKKNNAALEQNLLDLKEYNDNLVQLNQELASIVSFLQATNPDGNVNDGDFDEVIGDTTELIDRYRGLSIQNLEIQYSTIAMMWRCTLNDEFPGTSFTVNPVSVPIGQPFLTLVMGHLDQTTLAPLCSDMGDFNTFLSQFTTQDEESLTLSTLTQAVDAYYDNMALHYFPDGLTNDGGVSQNNTITEVEWEKAGFECDGLEDGRSYKFVS